MGRDPIPMVNSFIFSALIGTVLGILAGLGVGGGSLLMLWLTAVISMDYAQARTINLLFFLPCALIATFFRWRQGAIKIKEVLPAIIAGCVCAIGGTVLSGMIHLELLKKLFGGLLILSGIREIFYRPRKAR